MLYPAFSLILTMKGLPLAMSQVLYNKTTYRSVTLMGNLEISHHNRVYALDSGFFFHQKRSQYLSNSVDFPQLGERISPDYDERKKGKRFFSAPNPIHFHNRGSGVQSRAVF